MDVETFKKSIADGYYDYFDIGDKMACFVVYDTDGDGSHWGVDAKYDEEDITLSALDNMFSDPKPMVWEYGHGKYVYKN